MKKEQPPPPYYLKLRRVPSRYYGHETTFEGRIIGRREAGLWNTIGTSRGHATMDLAREATLRLADKRGIAIESDPRKVRAAEFKARYGDDNVRTEEETMSRIASFASIERDMAIAHCREILRASRERLERFVKDPQKDGADKEVLVKAFADINRVLGALR